MKILVITEKFGDLGNRLFRFARFYSATPPNFFLCDLSFYQYAYIYSPRNVVYYFIFKCLSFLNKKFYLHIVKKIKRDCVQINLLSDPLNKNNYFVDDVFKEAQKTKSQIIAISDHGFYYKTNEIKKISKYKLRKIFKIKNKYRKKAHKFLSSVKRQSVLVGVHMRRGDYRKFNAGAFYYDDEFYLKNILNLKNTYFGAKKLKFLLISNEPIDLVNYSSVDFLHFGMQDTPVDMSLLESCDYILAPPSTFSGWCSFIQDIPMFILRDKNISCSWTDFIPCNVNNSI